MTLEEAIKHCEEKSCGNNACALEHEQLAEWLKELKKLQSQSQWKPSDEQMRPLEYAIDYFKKKKNNTTYLESLYQDLKKLREE